MSRINEHDLCITRFRLCGLAYNIFAKILDDEQYVGMVEEPSNRLFNQFHKSQTDEMKKDILREIISDHSNLRVLFATSALGMGVDIPYVETVVHIGPPSTMETYMQQIGRAGRSHKQANAVLIWHNADIGANISHMSDEMRRYCRSEDCLRSQLVGHFGFPVVPQTHCCSVCTIISTESSIPDMCKRMSAMLPAQIIVRNAAMNRPQFLCDLRQIIDDWKPDPVVMNFFDVDPLPNGIVEEIVDDVQFITGVEYLFENFKLSDVKLARDIMQCIVKHTAI